MRSFRSLHCVSGPFFFISLSYKILSCPDTTFHVSSYMLQLPMSGIMYNSLDHCSIVSVSTISSGNWVSAKNHLYARSHHLQDGVDSRTSNLSFKSLNCLSIVSVITVSCSGCFWVTHLSFHSSMILYCDPHILGHPVFYPAILSPPCGYCTCDKFIHCYPCKLLDWIYRNCCCLFWEAVCRSSVIFC